MLFLTSLCKCYFVLQLKHNTDTDYYSDTDSERMLDRYIYDLQFEEDVYPKF